MTNLNGAGTFSLGDRTVNRMGYGAMQLAGPHVFGPPKDRAAAVAVLREAVASGVNHIDTSDFYGPHVTNQIIREALHPYPKDLVIVTKVGARRGDDASWIPARTPAELTRGVHDNLRNLGVDALDVVNLRVGGIQAPSEGSIEQEFAYSGRPPAPGSDPPTRLEQCDIRPTEAGARTLPRWSACRTTITSSIVTTTRSLTNWRTRASPMCPFSPWAGSRRCSHRLSQTSRLSLAQRPCRPRSPGCCTGRATFS